MENYEDLLRRKYLLGTPKEQYEWVDALVKRNTDLEATVNNMGRTLVAIRDNPTIPDGIKTVLQATIEVSETRLKLTF